MIEVTDHWGRVLAQMLGAKPTDLGEPARIDHPARVKPIPTGQPRAMTVAEFAQRNSHRRG